MEIGLILFAIGVVILLAVINIKLGVIAGFFSLSILLMISGLMLILWKLLDDC